MDSDIVELNVGGVIYTTTRNTLGFDSSSLLAASVATPDNSGKQHAVEILKDSKNRKGGEELGIVVYLVFVSGVGKGGKKLEIKVVEFEEKGRLFIDRDGVLFRYILDYLRNQGKLVLPENFCETARLRLEAEFFQLHNLATALKGGSPLPLVANNLDLENENSLVAFVTIGYRGTFFSGPESSMRGAGLGDIKDVKFRKLSRILVCGKVVVCREIFGDTLNESRDPDRGHTERYSSRFFLKHNHLEAAFESLACAHFRLVTSCASGTSAASGPEKPGIDHEESRWQHYCSYIFQRP